MNDFVKNAVSTMSIDADTARSATGALLKAARENLSADDYAKIAENVDGVDELIAESPQEKKPEEGIKEAAQGLLGRATEALGAETEGSVGVGALLGAAGLAPEQMPRFVDMFVEYMREKVGSDVTGNMLSKMSGLLDLKSGEATV
ncbi:MAG: DUF2780 domain-containing protein [Armatimonadota bacterium]